MRDLKFTIITTSYNQGDFIEETICSIIKQDYKHIEYFIIDGGSTDNSIEVIRKYQDKITFWISEKDSGQSNALNKGLRKATGDILIWINSDDILENGALSKVSAYFNEHPSVEVIHGRTILFQDSGSLIRGADDNCLPEQYLSGMAFPQPSAFIRTSALRNYHPLVDESLHYGMDYDLFSCLYLNGSFLSVPEIFSKYRLHSQSKTVKTNKGFAEDWQKVFCKIISSLSDCQYIKDSLKALSMWHETNGVYPVSRSFDGKFIAKSFQHFLSFQINFYYRDLELERVKKIGKFIKRNFPEFYKEQNLKRLHLISTIPLARFIIPLLRKPTF